MNRHIIKGEGTVFNYLIFCIFATLLKTGNFEE